MKNIFKVLSVCIVLSMLLSLSVAAREVSVPQTEIASVSIPDEYMVCTLESCDDNLKTTLENTPYGSYEAWVEDAMKPDGIYLFGMTEDGNQFFVKFNKITNDETQELEDGLKTHKLMKDYNMVGVSISKDKQISAQQDSLSKSGIVGGDVQSVEWIDFKGGFSPYIRSVFTTSGIYATQYHTIYNGNMITVLFYDNQKADDARLAECQAVFESIVPSVVTDYSEAKEIVVQNEVSQSEENEKIDDNSTIIIIIVSAIVLIALGFAVYLATRKRRKTIIKKD